METSANQKWIDIPLNARREMKFMEYLKNLKKDLYQRYPEKVNNEEGKNVCVLDEVEAMFQVSIPSERVMKYIKSYLTKVREIVYFYGDSIQWMDLEESGAEMDLKKLLYSDIDLTNVNYENDHRFDGLLYDCNETEFLTQLRAIYYQLYE